MRTRAAAAIVALLALSVLSGCGDDDEGARAAVDEPAPAADGAGQPDLEAAVAAGQLEPDDLGVGWELTESKAPGEDDDEPNPVDGCLQRLDDRFDDSKVAESEERTFQREGDAPLPAEVMSSSIAVDDAALLIEMHDLLRSPDFAACLHSGFEESMASLGGEADVTVGDVAQADGTIDSRVDPQLSSTTLSMPITTGMDGLTLDLAVQMVFLSTGQLGASILVVAPEGEVPADEVAEWGRLLAERLAGA